MSPGPQRTPVQRPDNSPDEISSAIAASIAAEERSSTPAGTTPAIASKNSADPGYSRPAYAEKKRTPKSKRRRREAGGANATRRDDNGATTGRGLTWFAVVPLLLFIVLFAAVNPQLTVFGTGVMLLGTALFATILNRPSWARFKDRGASVIGAGIAIIVICCTVFLPSSPIRNAQLYTDFPELSDAAAVKVHQGWTSLDKRFGQWPTADIGTEAVAICRDDYRALTPDEAVQNIIERVEFADGGTLDAPQSREMISVVRAQFCGQPGERGAVIDSEFMFTPIGLWNLVTGASPAENG